MSRFGGKGVCGWFMLASIVGTLLTPVGTRISPMVLAGLRFIEGVGQVRNYKEF